MLVTVTQFTSKEGFYCVWHKISLSWLMVVIGIVVKIPNRYAASKKPARERFL